MTPDINIQVPATIITDILVKVQQAIYNCMDREGRDIDLINEYPCGGSIDVRMDREGKCEVQGFSSKYRPLTALAAKIQAALPLWQSVEEEWRDDRGFDEERDSYWQDHGFASEYDFWMYKEG